MRAVVAAVALAMVAPATATADAGLTIEVTHGPSHLLPGMVAAQLTVTVANPSRRAVFGEVVVTDTLPAGVTATRVAGAGWTCTGTTCSRSDRLAGHASYPPIRIIADVAADVPDRVTNRAAISGGAQAEDAIPLRDGCPYGWAPRRSVAFAPPAGAVDSGVPNPERADGCTLLDLIWRAEPFASHREFVEVVERATVQFADQLSRRERTAVVAAAARSEVGGPRDHQIPDTCDRRIALTFDDGTSPYRPKLLQVLRDKQVHATFFDNGVRVAANPQWARFQVREGHVELNHTVLHVHMDQLPAAANRAEVLENAAILARAGAPLTFLGVRPPFGGSNPDVQRELLELGYTYFLNRIDGEDWLPDKSATAIADDIVRKLVPGVIAGMHDGPIDTTAGAATVEAVGMIIDRARALGYCFGVVDETGHVVADRYVSSGRPIPALRSPVPYHLPLAFGVPQDIPRPFVRIPSPLQISATHSPAIFRRGQTGALTLTVANQSHRPGDGAAVTVTTAVPPGLVATGASGDGWTCDLEVSCTRADGLPPGRSYPPITVTVAVSNDAPATVTATPALSAHGESWTDEATERIRVG